MDIEDITYRIIGAAYTVHNTLGPGLLESCYEEAMIIQLTEAGLRTQRQVALPIYYHGQKLESGLRLDLLVENTVVVELKSVETLLPVHHKQLLSYLKIAEKPVGLLINFNEDNLRHGLSRKLNGFYPSCAGTIPDDIPEN